MFVLVAVGLLFGVVMVLQVRSYRKLKNQTKFMLLQSQEIKKQMQELQAQNRRLEELNNEKQQIIGVVSHDLKGPFNRIFALTQLMSRTADNFTEEQSDYLGKIHQIVADGLGMVRNLLDNRRLEDKGLEVVMEPLNATAALSSLVKNYRVLAEKKKTEILFESPANAILLGDKVYLNRIMDNLLSNAIKFSPPGKRVYVSVRQTEQAAEISVRDEGPGISPEDQKKLFQKYQRLGPRPTGGESSTGLGLYLIQAMVVKMGGSVVCESKEGEGATFTVRLKVPEAVNLAEVN